MTRTRLVVMGALLGSGCAGPRTLREETQPVGATCPRTTTGMISGTYACPAGFSPDPLDAAYEFRPENGALHVVLCNAGANASGLFGNFHFDVREPTLGTHTLPEYASSIPPTDGDTRSSWSNAGGTVEVEGYDPTTGTVCGTFDIPFRAFDGVATRRETGTFVATLP